MKTITLILGLMLSISTMAQKVNIAAAANLKYVLEEIKAQYIKEHPKTTLNISFGSSGALVQQILNGANFDFFMSADNEYTTKLKEKGATTGNIEVYVTGKLVIYSTTIDVSKGLGILSNAGIKKIAIAKPEAAPYGDRAIEVLKRQGMMDLTKDKIVYADNITQAAQFAYTGNAEIGFIALSLAISPEMMVKGKYYVISPDQYTPIHQACVRIKTAVLNTETIKFMNYILSPTIRPIWEKYGYSTPSK